MLGGFGSVDVAVAVPGVLVLGECCSWGLSLGVGFLLWCWKVLLSPFFISPRVWVGFALHGLLLFWPRGLCRERCRIVKPFF